MYFCRKIVKRLLILTFLDVVEYIGIDKVKKTNIKAGRFPIITSCKVANNQIGTSTGEWLTVPTLVKDIIQSVARRFVDDTQPYGNKDY